jgi:DNA-binding response OmpR family regulator
MAKRLLIVDDEPTLRWCLGRFFTVSGFSVSSAATLQEALDASRDTRFDVVLTDLMLSGTRSVDGFVLAARLRESSPRTRIVMLTGHCTAEVQRDARMAHVDLLLVKPQPLPTLASHVLELASATDP